MPPWWSLWSGGSCRPIMPAGLGQEYKWRPHTLKYCNVIHQANNCSINYVLFSYSAKDTFILTWRASPECKIFYSSNFSAQIWWHEKSFPPAEPSCPKKRFRCTHVDTPVHECKMPYPLQPAAPWSTLEGIGPGPFGQGILGSHIAGAWFKGKDLDSKGAPQVPHPVRSHREGTK